jgi:hypothetical protein
VTAAGGTLTTASSSVISLWPRRLRPLAGPVLLAAALGAALWAPIPTLPDTARDAVIGRLEQRLPGWHVQRLTSSWEGAYTVVISCVGRELGFQFVPGHGLPPGAAWVLPDDPYSRRRLTGLSDHLLYLVWYPEDERSDALSCDDELARSERNRD